MSTLNSLTAKILQDAKLKAEEIVKQAQNEAKEIIEEGKREGELVKAKDLHRAIGESKIRSERMKTSTELSIRNNKLKAKGEIIDKVFILTLEKLSALSDEEYITMMKNHVSNLNLFGDEVLYVPSKYKNVVSDYLQEVNEKIGEKGSISLGEDREVTSGFLIARGGIEMDYTFSSILSFMREDLEYELAKELFG